MIDDYCYKKKQLVRYFSRRKSTSIERGEIPASHVREDGTFSNNGFSIWFIMNVSKINHKFPQTIRTIMNQTVEWAYTFSKQ